MARTPKAIDKEQLTFGVSMKTPSPSGVTAEGHTCPLVHPARAHTGQAVDQKLKLCSYEMPRGRTEVQGKTGWARVTSLELRAHRLQSLALPLTKSG